MKHIKIFLFSLTAAFGLGNLAHIEGATRNKELARYVAPFFNSTVVSSGVQTRKVVQLIANRDVKGLNKLDATNYLTFKREEGLIAVDGNPTGRVRLVLWGATNALVFVLLHSALNESTEDDAKTLAMLDVLLEKGLELNAVGRTLDFTKENPDVSPPMSLVQIALSFSFPEAVEKLLKKGACFDASLINEARERGQSDLAELLERYKAQAK